MNKKYDEGDMYLVTTLYAINIPMMMRERQTAQRRPTKINFLLFAPSVIVYIDDTENLNTVLKASLLPGIYFL